MDNASKALIMAGGILIAVMVIGLSLRLLAGARGFASASNEQMELSAIESFNRYYLSFGSSGTTIYGIDALNIYNKAQDDMKRTNSMHPVTVNINQALINALNAPTGIELMSNKNFQYSYSFDQYGYVNQVTIATI